MKTRRHISFLILLCFLSVFFSLRAQVVDTVALDRGWNIFSDETTVEPVADSMDGALMDSLLLYRRMQERDRREIDLLTHALDSNFAIQAVLRQQLSQLSALKDSLVATNDLYQQELQEKNRLMSEQVRALQEKETLLAEKEALYRQALTNSTIDKALWEGELRANEASIEAKTREIEYLQRDIDAKEVTLQAQRESYNNLLSEKERYRILVDSLQQRVIAVEMENIRKQEENKYLQQKAKDAEERAAITLNKKKKVRPIQGIAMRFFRTPDWDIRLTPKADEPGKYDKVVRNRNAGDIEFDFVTGASVMLWDLTDVFNRNDDSSSVEKRLGEIPRFDQKFNYDLGIYVGFGGSNLFKNFYIGPSFRFVDFFYLTLGVNICEYEMLIDGYSASQHIDQNLTLDDITAKSWLVKPFISLSIDLDFLSYIKK